MARAIIIQAGPLVAAAVNKVATTTKAAGANYIVLDGAAGTATAASVCATQTPSGAGALLLNGTLATTNSVAGAGGTAAVGSAVVRFPTPVRIYITAAGNESGNTFTVVGTVQGPDSFGPGIVVTEVITGPNTSKVSSVNLYSTIISITISGAGANTMTVGHYGTATLDKARRILFTPAGADSGITYTLVGTDGSGDAIGETLQGVDNASTTYTLLDYLTVSSIKLSGASASTMQVGTNQICSSPWARLDELGAMGPTALQVDGTGTVNWTVQQTLNDDNVITNQLPTPTYKYAASAINWVNHPDSNLVASTTTTGVQGNYAYPPTFARITMNSNGGVTAYAALTVLQNYQK